MHSQVAEHICLIMLDELLFQQFLEIAIMGGVSGVHKTAETLANSILNGKGTLSHVQLYCMYIT